MSVLPDLVRCSKADHFLDCLSDLYLDILALAYHAHISASQLSQQVQRWLWLLTQRQTQAVLLAALPNSLLDVVLQPVEPVRRTRAVDTLVTTLMVVEPDPVIQSLAGISERGEVRLTQELTPDRLPEPLDLSQGHRMMRSRTDVLDTLLLQYPLEPRLATPGHELAPIVGQDLPGGAPLADRALDHFENRGGGLLTEQAPADHKTAMVIDDADQIHTVHPLELEGKDIDLPHRVGQRTLEAARLRWPAPWLWRGVLKTGLVDGLPHLLGADR
jgi:hypothetical protein